MRLPEPLGGRLARGVAWSLSGAVGLQAATALGAILTARVLGQTGFGELSLVRSTVVMMAALAGGGLGLAATQNVAELRDRDPLRAGRALGLLTNVALAAGTLAGLACWVLARPLAAWLSEGPDLATALRTGAPLLVVGAFGSVVSGALAGLEAFRAAARLTLLEAILGLVLIPSGGWLLGVSGAVGGGVAAALVALPFKVSVLSRHLRGAGIVVARCHTRAEWQALSRFALPALLLGFSAPPFEWLARVALAREPGGLAELGLFAAAFSWGNAVLFLPLQVSGAALPILTHTASAADRAGFSALLRSLAIATAGLGLAVALPLAVAAGPIMASYGPGFAAGVPALRLVLGAYALAAFSGLFRAVLVATGRLWWQLLHAVIWGLALLAVTSVLSADGAVGLGAGYLVAYAVSVVTQGLSVRGAVSESGVAGEGPAGCGPEEPRAAAGERGRWTRRDS
jgi:O-antigen/teichoic acid export membrane protein